MNDKLADSIIYDKKQYIAELKAEITAKDARIAELEAALKWYAETVADCNRFGGVGDVARDRLAKDVGQKARVALERGER